jgi:hypothetical protein
MSETSQAVGRIAVLSAFTLLFAAAWRGDAPESSRPATVVAWTKRESGSAAVRGTAGGIVAGLALARPAVALPTQMTGQRLTSGTRRVRTRAPLLFSRTPSTLGRAATPVLKDTVETASAGSEPVR